MDKILINELGDELYQAMVNREAISPLTERGFDISIDDAYHISLRMLERRLSRSLARRSGLPARRCRTCSMFTSRTLVT
jgi:2-keto-4-pentenoate hydratase